MFPSLEVTPPVTKAQVSDQVILALTREFIAFFLQIGADCLVGESSHLSDKCSVKHSVIGQSCTIGEKVRITNCILMDNVTIREG